MLCTLRVPSWFSLFVVTLVALPALAQDRGLGVEGPSGDPLDLVDMVRAQNPDAAFEVAVELSGGMTVAREGETVRFRVRSDRSGYLTLVNRNPEGAVTLLYPNRFAPAQRIEAGEEVFFPSGGEFRIRVSGPFGQELVKAIVTPEPLIDSDAAERFWGASPLASVEGAPPGSVGTDLGGLYPVETWATSTLYLTTAPAQTAQQPTAPPTPPDVPADEAPSGSGIAVPPSPQSSYSSNPGRSWRNAYRVARGMQPWPSSRSLGDDDDVEAERPAPSASSEPEHDGTLLVLYRPAVGSRSFGESYSGGGFFDQLRVVDTRTDSRNSAGTRSLHETYGDSFEDVLAGLQDDPDVLLAIPNYQVQAFQPISRRALAGPSGDERAPTPDGDDPPKFWPMQWALHNAYWRSEAERVDMRWREALAAYVRPDKPVVVAVLDTGIHFDNPHLAPVFWSNVDEVPGNGIDDDGNGYIDDTRGWDAIDRDNDPTDASEENSHGTFVAAQIAGGGAESVLYGMAPDVQIMPVRVLGGDGRGGYRSIIEGIQYAAQNGARVINMSLGQGPSSEPIPALERMLGRAFDEADRLGALLVISAGNESADSRATFTYPARVSQSNTISVAALNMRGHVSSYSNHGPHVDVAAPGTTILGYPGRTDAVESWDGTSMAAPHVAALAAMIWAKHPDWTPSEVKASILETAHELPGLDVRTGATINAEAALLR